MFFMDDIPLFSLWVTRMIKIKIPRGVLFLVLTAYYLTNRKSITNKKFKK